MVRALHISRPGWTIELLTFVLGDRGFFDEALWKEHWERLKLPDSAFKGFATLAVQSAHEVADEILTTYQGAIKAKKTGDG